MAQQVDFKSKQFSNQNLIDIKHDVFLKFSQQTTAQLAQGQWWAAEGHREGNSFTNECEGLLNIV